MVGERTEERERWRGRTKWPPCLFLHLCWPHCPHVTEEKTEPRVAEGCLADQGHHVPCPTPESMLLPRRLFYYWSLNSVTQSRCDFGQRASVTFSVLSPSVEPVSEAIPQPFEVPESWEPDRGLEGCGRLLSEVGGLHGLPILLVWTLTARAVPGSRVAGGGQSLLTLRTQASDCST